MPLPEDPFTDSMTPHLQWFPQQRAYMQPAQHSNQYLLEHCKTLELQIVKLTSERDTLKSMFQQLSSAVRLHQTDSLDLDCTLISSVPATANRPTRVTHPKIRFWTNDDFLGWLDSPDGRRADRGKVPYLEDENGDPLTDPIVKSIRKLLRGAWAELVRRKLAPKTWGKATATARQIVQVDPTVNILPSTPDSLLAPSPTMPNSLAAESMLLLSRSHPTTPSRAPSPTIRLSPILLPNNPNSRQLPAIPPASPEFIVAEKENIPPPTPDPIAPPIKIIMTNSLSTLALAAVGTLIPPLPSSIDPPLKAPLANDSADSKGKKGKADDFASGKGTSKTSKKMRPSPTRNGRNLCALRWLKQIKTDGTTEEFCLYYVDLTAEQRKNYDDEASALVASNTWVKNVCDGAMH
ncbi:uncharacterized protein BJ212DRAFT_1326866 [Suillus subaureus]|uniref:Uncharacterized protein n=1 Tax=Suillus subaureus TaxID=48587 RepID=A0A9P7EKI9_9AGAM|nr:uncharacterized protein BJ212DRAFT_1326866 [Suillus subaureus]KAG1823834.1 hypothetical protein BJ212DRAFT_1326866 [Suillus subaureus]